MLIFIIIDGYSALEIFTEISDEGVSFGNHRAFIGIISDYADIFYSFFSRRNKSVAADKDTVNLRSKCNIPSAFTEFPGRSRENIVDNSNICMLCVAVVTYAGESVAFKNAGINSYVSARSIVNSVSYVCLGFGTP